MAKRIARKERIPLKLAKAQARRYLSYKIKKDEERYVLSAKLVYERTRALRRLGFYSYGEYLASDTWIRVRKAVFRRARWRCYFCNAPATQVHHKRYSFNSLSGKTLAHTAACCDRCHKSMHGLPQ